MSLITLKRYPQANKENLNGLPLKERRVNVVRFFLKHSFIFPVILWVTFQAF